MYRKGKRGKKKQTLVKILMTTTLTIMIIIIIIIIIITNTKYKVYLEALNVKDSSIIGNYSILHTCLPYLALYMRVICRLVKYLDFVSCPPETP